MNEHSYVSNRTFKVWDYNITHRLLLLRSPKGGDYKTNIDIQFRGVSYVELPTLLKGLKLVEPTSEEIERIHITVSDKFLEEDFRIVASLKKRFVVVSIAQHVVENELDIFETSLTPV